MLYEKDETIFLILFVDDLLMFGRNGNRIQEIKINLSKRFSIKDLGETKIYLGINIDYDYKKGIMKLDQSAYIESLAQKYNITDAK